MEHTQCMARGHGWYTLDIELGFSSACEWPRLVRISVLDLTQLSSTELEASVSGYAGAIFRSCSSVTEAQIRFRLFVARVSKWFASPDPFFRVEDLMMEIEIEDSDDDDNYNGDKGDEEMEPESQPATPELAILRLPLAPQAGGLLNAAPIDLPAAPIDLPATPIDLPAASIDLPTMSVDPPATSNGIEEPPKSALTNRMMPASSALSDATDPQKPGSSTRSPPHPGDGWYVVHHAVLPGVYYGV